MTIEVRATGPDELRAAAATLVRALLGSFDDAAWEKSRPSWEEMPSISAWDGPMCVGHAGQFSVDTVVPGGARLATGGVSRVGVLTTHRRRGVATALMQRLVADSAEAGRALMSLRASETPIYGRFGFGMAGESANLEIDVIRAAPLSGAAAGGTCQFVPAAELLDVLPLVYDRVITARPGAISRPTPSWWRRELRPILEDSAASTVAVHLGADGEPDGFVHYDTEWNDDEPDEAPTGRGKVRQLFATTIGAELALWQFLFDIDLVTRWRANGRPLDDAIRRAAADTRAVRVRAVEDEQWLRIIDVECALSERQWAPVNGGVRIAVTDELVPANDATWEITSAGTQRTAAAAQLRCDVAALSAAYLGGVSWSALTGAGRVEVIDDSSLSIADALFAVPRLPWCGTFF